MKHKKRLGGDTVRSKFHEGVWAAIVYHTDARLSVNYYDGQTLRKTITYGEKIASLPEDRIKRMIRFEMGDEE